jgi:hypothetical protein
MTDRPIIFSAPMVRALLDGRKTMTRRLAWGKPVGVDVDDLAANDMRADGFKVSGPDDTEHRIVWPRSLWQRAQPGDRLWVRENLAVMGNWGVWHDASEPPGHGKFLDDIDARGRALLERYAPTEATDSRRIPSIHMPRWASRLTLVITATKIERVQSITEADACAEGSDFAIAGQNADHPIMPIRLRPTHTSLGIYAIYPVVSHRAKCHISGVGGWSAE